MKLRVILYLAIILSMTVFSSESIIAQALEVDGQAKITDMPTENSADQIVVKLPDGTLAVRSAATLAQSAGNYGSVVNPVTGKEWLDRNLGATQVATSSTDEDSYGDLYQWGRAADGHQVRTSTSINLQATNWFSDEGTNSWDGKYINGFTNWLISSINDLWSGTAAENNPCPSGYRVPTNAEWNQERLTWSSDNAAGAFDSPLKLPLAGGRNYFNGGIVLPGTNGYYWSSTVNGTFARILYFSSSEARINNGNRGDGLSVRCIKD